MASEPVNMHDRIRPGLQRLATRPVVIPTVLAALFCLAGFQWRDARLGGLELLDTRQWYSPEQAAALFGALDRLDSRARAVYAWTEVSIDMIFPVAYGLLLALLLLRVFEDGRRLYLLPIAGAATDVFENLSIALLASTYDGAPSSWTRVAAAFTLLKSGLILATLAAVMGGVIRWLRVVRRPFSSRRAATEFPVTSSAPAVPPRVDGGAGSKVDGDADLHAEQCGR